MQGKTRQATLKRPAAALKRPSIDKKTVENCKNAITNASCDRRPLFSFGVIADLQYADAEDATDFSGKEKRGYRNTLWILDQAIKKWNTAKVPLAVNLGDLIDGRNAVEGQSLVGSDEALERVLKYLAQGPAERIDVLGNHELYNFSREQLSKTGLKITDSAGRFYYAVDPHPKWRLVILDPYEISTIGYPESHPRRRQAVQIINEKNPTVLSGSGDWFEGIPAEKHRYVPYNGGLSNEQLDWLKTSLDEAQATGRQTLVLSHIPLYEPATTSGSKVIIWNAEEVLSLLHLHTCVVAVLSGHDHLGGYAVDHAGVHHITCCSPMTTISGVECSGIVECHDSRAILKAHGRLVVESGSEGKGRSYSEIWLERGRNTNLPSGPRLE